jgi:hypothetical protein
MVEGYAMEVWMVEECGMRRKKVLVGRCGRSWLLSHLRACNQDMVHHHVLTNTNTMANWVR